MPEEPAIRWTVVVNPHRAWVFERKGPRGRMKSVFSLANPTEGPGPAPAERAMTGWASNLAEHLRLARSAGRYDYLEVIAEGPVIQTVDLVTRHHVDHALEAVVEGREDGAVRRAASRLLRQRREQN
jgi:hypothetical protein